MSDIIPCPFCGDPMEYWSGAGAIGHTRMTAKCILGDQAFDNVQKWNTRATDIDAIRRDARNDALRTAAEKCHKIAWPVGYTSHPSEYGKGSAAAFDAATECASAITAMIEDKP